MEIEAEIEEKIKKLSPDEQQEIINHINDILNSKNKDKSYKPTFAWAGGLSFLKSEYTSVELQKKSNEWLAGDI